MGLYHDFPFPLLIDRLRVIERTSSGVVAAPLEFALVLLWSLSKDGGRDGWG